MDRRLVRVLREGWLEKRARRAGVWQRRYVMLLDDKLVYFHRAPEADLAILPLPEGAAPLADDLVDSKAIRL